MMEFVSDDDIPNIWKVIKAMFQTTNQMPMKNWNLATDPDIGRRW